MDLDGCVSRATAREIIITFLPLGASWAPHVRIAKMDAIKETAQRTRMWDYACLAIDGGMLLWRCVAPCEPLAPPMFAGPFAFQGVRVQFLEQRTCTVACHWVTKEPQLRLKQA